MSMQKDDQARSAATVGGNFEPVTEEKTLTLILRLLVYSMIVALLWGCSNKPVRHLASDASLVKKGVSTKEDVLTFLGDPDARQTISASTERWIYYEESESTMQKTPYLGKLFGSSGYDQIVVTFEGETVVDCRFNSFESDEFDWSDDYSWQEQRQ